MKNNLIIFILSGKYSSLIILRIIQKEKKIILLILLLQICFYKSKFSMILKPINVKSQLRNKENQLIFSKESGTMEA